MAESPSTASHAREAEIGGVSEHGGHQGSRIVRRRAGPQMHQSIGEARPTMDFCEKLGDSQTRQHGVEAAGNRIDRFVLRSTNGTDRQAFFSKRGLWQLAGGGERVDFAKPSLETLGLIVAPVLETIEDAEAQLVRVAPCLVRVARQQKVVEGTESTAAFDPDVPRSQPLAQRNHNRDLIGTAIISDIGPYDLAPYWPEKTHRRPRRKFLRSARVKLAHDVERLEQRIVLLPRSEGESTEHNWRHSSDARIALNDFAEIVRSGVDDSGFRLGDQGFQPLPAERTLDGSDLVFVSGLSGEHGLSHAEQGARRSVERLGAVDRIVLMGAVSAPEHSAEHLVEHGERGVRENDFHLAREHNQGRQTARRVESRDVAGNEDGDFSRDRRIARPVDALFAIGSDAKLAYGLEPLDDSEQIFLARRFRPFSQPTERRAYALFGYGQQRVQRGDRLQRQALGEAFVRTLARNRTRRKRKALQFRRGWQPYVLFSQIRDHGGNNRITTISSGALLNSRPNDSPPILPPERSRVEIGLQSAEMLPTRFAAARIRRKLLRLAPDLCRDERQHPGRWRFLRPRRAAWKS